jgi:hypothetical protein
MLRELTGLRRSADLLELGRIADEVVDSPPGKAVLVDWVGAAYGVAVIEGSVVQLDRHRVRTAGEVFRTGPHETLQSLGAVVIITAAHNAHRLEQVLSAPRRPRVQRVTPAISSSAAAYGSS